MTYVSFVISLKFVLQSGLPDVALIHISVVNWGGEEVARVEVLPSDTVLVGQLQIEDQIGVPPKNQRLVLGEKQLEETECWTGVLGPLQKVKRKFEQSTKSANTIDLELCERAKLFLEIES